VNEKKSKLAWSGSLQTFLHRNPGLRKIDDPEKLEYYRNDLNVDLPPLIRDLMLKSLPDLILQPTAEEHLVEIFSRPCSIAREKNSNYGNAGPEDLKGKVTETP
jgi:hypothetical protein